MSELQELIARLEQASGPDRELDREIELVWTGSPSDATPFMPHYFTASIDAALMLVPESCHVLNLRQVFEANWCAGVALKYAEYETATQWDAQASTPAIALCIAALKARATLSATPVLGNEER